MSELLLLRPDRAGDALKTLPVVRALKTACPKDSISVLASEHNASLFASEPGIKLYVLPPHWNRMGRERILETLKFPTPFDLAVNLLCDKFEDAEKLLTFMPATKKCSAHGEGDVQKLTLPRPSPAAHDETTNIATLVSIATGVDVERDISVFPSAPVLTNADLSEAQEKMGKKAGNWLGLCPLASNKHRTHPLKKWERFVEHVTDSREFDRFFLFGHPSDYRTLETLVKRSKRRDRTELCFPSSFRTLGAYLMRLDGVIAVDSGPLHLARSLGVRSLGILAGGDVRRWFADVREGSLILRRGILNRYPTSLEMQWAYGRWINTTKFSESHPNHR